MRIFSKIIENKKILLILDVVLLIVAIKYGKNIYEFESHKAKFVNQLEEFKTENKDAVFKIGKIILHSSANAIDDSDGRLENISISQFTDIAIYIDNKNKSQELSAENTVKEIYIDNIKLTMNTENGDYIFNYKNPKKFGKYLSLENYKDNRISMNVITTNEEIKNVDYNKNIFYTDCSNPLALGFVNRNFITNGVVSDTNGQIMFDGSILKNANVDLQAISGKIEFLIHIKNNLGEKFICNLTIDNDLTKDKDNLLNGYSILIEDTQGQNYEFLKLEN